jgi:hypothetical protein
MGLVGAPILIFILGAIVNAFNPACGTPGDSGGCEMWLVSIAVMTAIPGAVIGAVLGNHGRDSRTAARAGDEREGAVRHAACVLPLPACGEGSGKKGDPKYRKPAPHPPRLAALRRVDLSPLKRGEVKKNLTPDSIP